MTQTLTAFEPTVLQSLISSSLDGIVILDNNWQFAYANPAACQILGREEANIIGHKLLDFIAEPWRNKQVLQSTSNQPGLYDTVIVRPSGETRVIAYSTERLPSLNSESSFAIFRDVSDARLVEAETKALAEKLTRRNTELSTLLEVSRDAALTLELKSLLGQLLEKLKLVVDYDGAALFTLEQPGSLKLLCYRGPLAWESLTHQWDLNLAAHSRKVIESSTPIVIEDVSADTELAQAFRTTAKSQLGEIPAYIGTWLGVPLIVRDSVIGVLAFDHAMCGYYSASRIALAEAFAQQAAVAIENATLYAEAQGKAALEERARLARELHDSVSQALYGIVLGARAAMNALRQNPKGLQEPLEYILSLAEAGIAEMRALIFELRPESLAEEGLVAALARHAAAIKVRYELDVHTDFDEEPEIDLNLKEALYRISQEALHNVIKHAEASAIYLSLKTSKSLLLTIKDNGKGFKPDQEFPGHLGQRSMRERAQAIGAGFSIESQPGGGTNLEVMLDLPK